MHPKCDILTLRAHFLFEMMSLRVKRVCALLSNCFDLSFDILAVGNVLNLAVGNALNLGSTTHTACLILFSFSFVPDNLGLTANFIDQSFEAGNK